MSKNEEKDMSELIDRQAAIDAICKEGTRLERNGTAAMCEIKQWCIDLLERLPSAQPEQRWIPIKWHDCTDEDREKYGFNNDIVVVFDCEMPDDNQSILVTTSHGYVNQDVCYIDDSYSLDSGWDWIDDIKAWMPLPEPYKAESEDKE